MRKLIYIFLSIVTVSVCACRKETDKSAIVGNMAKVYYDYLLNGDYSSFVAGMDTPDSIPDNYRSQLVDNAKMFMAQMKDEHGGIDSIKVRRTVLDSLETSASVFLMFYYRDGLAEQVMVPLVERDTLWRMR